jgi:hypothetical protein
MLLLVHTVIHFMSRVSIISNTIFLIALEQEEIYIQAQKKMVSLQWKRGILRYWGSLAALQR